MKKIWMILLIIGITDYSIAQLVEGWKASPETVKEHSKLNTQFNFDEEKVPEYTLPDPLLTMDGKQVTSPRLWKKVRRQEILELFRENVFGRVPSTLYEIDFKIANEEMNAMDGAATLKQVEITISSEGKSLIIHLTLFIPSNAPKPVPIYLLINNRGDRIPNLTDPTRQVKSEWWPAEEVIARGYGIAVFNNSDVDPDNFDEFKNGIHGLLDRGERQGDSWGTLAAWAWGASRCMDYFETDKDINKKKVAVVGHSRGGKTALWAGAEDERFALVICNESGHGGASIVRRRFGQIIANTNNFWFCSNYKKYADKEDAFPVDGHMLISLIAPRAVYVTSASENLGSDPRGAYLALYHAVPVFQLLKTGGYLPETMPSVNHPVVAGKVGYHIRDGVHDMLLKDWNWFLDFGDKVLK